MKKLHSNFKKLLKQKNNLHKREFLDDQNSSAEKPIQSFRYRQLESDAPISINIPNDFEEHKNKTTFELESPTYSKSQQLNKVFCIDSVKNSSSENVSKVKNIRPNKSYSDIVSIGDLAISLNDAASYLKEQDKDDLNKSKSNVFMINISNSKNFLIGSQKTINVNNSNKSSLEESSKDFLLDGKTLEDLLDCEEKLSEDIIATIALNLHNHWRDFGRHLGVEESFLEELEFRNNSSEHLVIYDYLQKYINDFPNTSLGFVISILNNYNQMNVIEKLAACRTQNDL